MAEIYHTHDILLMPSVTEGSPLSLLEAMAGGLAVVAADVGGIPDIVRPETDGLLFPAGDATGAATAVGRLLKNPHLIAELGRASQRRADQLTWAITASAVEAAARSAICGDESTFSGPPGRWPPN
jgi:glycosyltransferase involved in cell wall biosynthesis